MRNMETQIANSNDNCDYCYSPTIEDNEHIETNEGNVYCEYCFHNLI